MMKERYLKEIKTMKMEKAKENVLNVGIQITLSESVQNYQEATIKDPLLEGHGVIATKMKKKRLKMKNVLWLKLLMSQILIIPFTGEAVFTNEWDLSSLAYSQETEGPYHTDLPNPKEIHQFLQFQRVDPNRTIKNKNVILSPNQVLTKELRKDLKRWNERIYENVFRLEGHQDHLSAFLAHILYCILAEQQYNLAYFFVKRIESARATPKAHLPYVMRPLALRQARQLRSDSGKARHSVSSTFAYHNRGSSSHQRDDDEDDGASRVSTPSPTTYLNSFVPLDYQPYDIPTSSEQNGDLLIECQTDLLNQTQQMHKELRGGFKSFGKVLRGVFSKKKK
nr:ribosomal protein L7Ae/L30e/S12e/Gadd45 [Tanacetum cinerariifolium]